LQIATVQLDQLPLRQKRRVTSIDWAAMPTSEGHRLRSLGLDEGVFVEALHKGILFWRDPIAVRVGRMTIALRRKVAAAIMCGEEPA
jgi:ferrous iron transport protein A